MERTNNNIRNVLKGKGQRVQTTSRSQRIKTQNAKNLIRNSINKQKTIANNERISKAKELQSNYSNIYSEIENLAPNPDGTKVLVKGDKNSNVVYSFNKEGILTQYSENRKGVTRTLKKYDNNGRIIYEKNKNSKGETSNKITWNYATDTKKDVDYDNGERDDTDYYSISTGRKIGEKNRTSQQDKDRINEKITQELTEKLGAKDLAEQIVKGSVTGKTYSNLGTDNSKIVAETFAKYGNAESTKNYVAQYNSVINQDNVNIQNSNTDDIIKTYQNVANSEYKTMIQTGQKPKTLGFIDEKIKNNVPLNPVEKYMNEVLRPEWNQKLHFDKYGVSSDTTSKYLTDINTTLNNLDQKSYNYKDDINKLKGDGVIKQDVTPFEINSNKYPQMLSKTMSGGEIGLDNNKISIIDYMQYNVPFANVPIEIAKGINNWSEESWERIKKRYFNGELTPELPEVSNPESYSNTAYLSENITLPRVNIPKDNIKQDIKTTNINPNKKSVGEILAKDGVKSGEIGLVKDKPSLLEYIKYNTKVGRVVSDKKEKLNTEIQKTDVNAKLIKEATLKSWDEVMDSMPKETITIYGKEKKPEEVFTFLKDDRLSNNNKEFLSTITKLNNKDVSIGDIATFHNLTREDREQLVNTKQINFDDTLLNYEFVKDPYIGEDVWRRAIAVTDLKNPQNKKMFKSLIDTQPKSLEEVKENINLAKEYAPELLAEIAPKEDNEKEEYLLGGLEGFARKQAKYMAILAGVDIIAKQISKKSKVADLIDAGYSVPDIAKMFFNPSPRNIAVGTLESVDLLEDYVNPLNSLKLKTNVNLKVKNKIREAFDLRTKAINSARDNPNNQVNTQRNANDSPFEQKLQAKEKELKVDMSKTSYEEDLANIMNNDEFKVKDQFGNIDTDYMEANTSKGMSEKKLTKETKKIVKDKKGKYSASEIRESYATEQSTSSNKGKSEFVNQYNNINSNITDFVGNINNKLNKINVNPNLNANAHINPNINKNTFYNPEINANEEANANINAEIDLNQNINPNINAQIVNNAEINVDALINQYLKLNANVNANANLKLNFNIDPKDKKLRNGKGLKDAYMPKLIYKGKEIYLNPNYTHKQAMETGMLIADRTPIEEFVIEKVRMPDSKPLNKGLKYSKHKKFKKKGSRYTERPKFIKDTKPENSNNSNSGMNLFKYIKY